MILVDTSIWIDHLRRRNARLSELLVAGRVSFHPFVLGELALGNVRDRKVLLDALAEQPCPRVAFDSEILMFIDRHALRGCGIGYVDAHLLAAARLNEPMRLWTRDRRLRAVAERLSVSADEG